MDEKISVDDLSCMDIDLGLLPNDQFVVPKQLVLDQGIGSLEKQIVLAAVFCRQHFVETVDKGILFKLVPELSDYKYRKAITRLIDAGYVSVESHRDGGGRFSGTRLSFRMPSKRPLINPICIYTNSKSSSETAGRNQSEKTLTRYAEERLKSGNRRSEPESKNLHPVDGSVENPRSEPECNFLSAGVGAPLNKQTLPIYDDLSGPEGVFPYDGRVTTVIEGSPSEEEDSNPSDGVCLFRGSQRELLERRKSEGREHVLENCTEEQVREVFDMVASRCWEKRFGKDQYLACRKRIDELFEGDGEYKRTFVETVRTFCYGGGSEVHRSKTPSFWLYDDFGDAARSQAQEIASMPKCGMGLFR